MSVVKRWMFSSSSAISRFSSRTCSAARQATHSRPLAVPAAYPVARARAAEVAQPAHALRMSAQITRCSGSLVMPVVAQQHVLRLDIAVADRLRQRVQRVHPEHNVPAAVRVRGQRRGRRSDAR